MFVVVSYDIPDDARRTRLFTLLKGYGQHTQYSVFECDLSSERFTEMVTRIRFLVDSNADHVRFYRLCAPPLFPPNVGGEKRGGEKYLPNWWADTCEGEAVLSLLSLRVQEAGLGGLRRAFRGL